MMKLFFALFLALHSSMLFADTFNVVYHLTDREKVGILISSVQELLKANPKNKIEVVVHGPAIMRLSKEGGLSAELQELIDQGVSIGACSAAMLKNNLPPDILIDGVVPLKQGGVLRILELQKQGYLYIKI